MKLKKRIFDISLLTPDPKEDSDIKETEEQLAMSKTSIKPNSDPGKNSSNMSETTILKDADITKDAPTSRSSRDLLRAKLLREVELGRELLRMGTLLEPGYSLIRGRILRQLHLPTLKLAKLKLQDGEISKAEFIGITRDAIKNMKLAVKCLEDFEVHLASTGASEAERAAATE